MKVFNNVRSTAKNIPEIEVNVDTVYLRTNIKRVDEDDFSGWEYQEIQYDKNKYIETISQTTTNQDINLLDLEFRQSLLEMGVSVKNDL